jgi:hypothetical protein
MKREHSIFLPITKGGFKKVVVSFTNLYSMITIEVNELLVVIRTKKEK